CQPTRRQRDRQSHNTTRHLPSEPAETPPDRESLRMDETNRRNSQNQATRTGESGLAVSDDRRGVQSVATSKNPNGRSVVESAENGVFQHEQARLRQIPARQSGSQTRIYRSVVALRPSSELISTSS